MHISAIRLVAGLLALSAVADAFLPIHSFTGPSQRALNRQRHKTLACKEGSAGAGLPSFNRRQLLASSSLSAGVWGVSPSLGLAMSDATPVGYQDVSVKVGGQSIPVSIWYPIDKSDPSSASAPSQANYPHKISVGKIATLLTRGQLSVPSFVGPSTSLKSGIRVVKGAAPSEGRPAVVFAHGYLGSRYDMMHVCEDLASKGFVVAAPELPESLAASFEVNDDITRPAIVTATLDKLRLNWTITNNLGIFGHSAGGGTSTMMEGAFPLGRVAIAGFRGYEGRDPLLVVASKGDGIIPLDRVKDALPRGTAMYTGIDGARQLGGSGGLREGQSAAVFFEEAFGGEKLPPNHISFLSEQSNDALVGFLSPLLPVARVLSVPVLDFDKYQEARDSRQTGEVLVPLVTGFFEANQRASLDSSML
mmetsp:Transcript_29564/g.74366  ORF Transcript_29564/g.74366 Transcript_29564/m.74366 type:complete len:420 (-) Transcript_29564:96-1355(-)|eukprot:CAMPEP_0173424058 /NCGR_PEP_ID=MMETSP1357-20121228/4091_1 /TAXON_ID=77926 /ORGANISM="Hemiselmis rufescens, Strain PCC563" /LENGTH=419 /DNA_ID=CAMNT_0014387227 /DNA_START=201 /DNA_END=1460 /DNA_ORIENTATION=+